MTVVLTKADLPKTTSRWRRWRAQVRALTGPDVETLVVSALDPQSVEAVRALVPPGSMAVLVGKSGVGKSSLVNLLVGADVQETAAVREADGKGRHTTVSREMIEVPGGGRVVDMPGVRGLGLWDADAGIGPRSPTSKRRRRAAVSATASTRTSPDAPCAPPWRPGELAPERWESYRTLKQETATVRERREQARWMQGEKASGSARACKARRARQAVAAKRRPKER